MNTKRIKLFCFPFAGGSSNSFRNWSRFVDSSIEIIPVELAGRGTRAMEPCYEDMESLIEDLVRLLKRELEGESYAFFGHSMGGAVVYMLTRALQKQNFPLPLHVFISGKGAPHIKRPDIVKHHALPTPEFIERINELGGTPPEFFDHPELLDFFLPILRSDFKIAETEIDPDEIIPLNTGITVIYGDKEDLLNKQISGWEAYTNKEFDILMCEGEHFFINDKTEYLLKRITQRLKDLSIH